MVGQAAGILKRKDPPHRVVPLDTLLQAVACRVSNFQPFTFCSIYIPPSSSWKHTDLLSLVFRLPPPILLIGYFNAHNIFRGLEVATFSLQSNLSLLNKKIYNTYSSCNGFRSSINLAICDPKLFLDLLWNAYDDLCGSDHLLVILSTSESDPQPNTPRWKLHKADWDTFGLLCQDRL